MMVAVAEPQFRLPAEGERMLLSGISWETYESLSRDVEAAGRGCRITYERGLMEVETPTRLHELICSLVDKILTDYCDAANIPYMPTRATTWRRRMKEQGIEADASYFIQHVNEAEGAPDESLDRCPPPDLAIETEITEPLLPKLPVYAGVGVPEVWHIRRDFATQFFALQADGTYSRLHQSVAVPFFTPELVEHWLKRRAASTHFDTTRAFRQEVLSQLTW